MFVKVKGTEEPADRERLRGLACGVEVMPLFVCERVTSSLWHSLLPWRRWREGRRGVVRQGEQKGVRGNGMNVSLKVCVNV